MTELNKYGIGFWIGAGLLSLVNMMMNLRGANALVYNYMLTGVAVIGLILNIILLKRNKK
jgi:hypothetical protein